MGSHLTVYIYLKKFFEFKVIKKVKTKANDYLRQIGNYFGALLPEIWLQNQQIKSNKKDFQCIVGNFSKIILKFKIFSKLN